MSFIDVLKHNAAPGAIHSAKLSEDDRETIDTILHTIDWHDTISPLFVGGILYPQRDLLRNELYDD